MGKRTDIKKIMVIGSGPIVIGQAAEFDYAGSQACIALKEEGYEVILVNSNPATIMSDKVMADKVFMEPLTIEYLSKIIRKERPDAILPGLGGQTGLNLVVELATKGILEECQVEILSTDLKSINQAEDRELFKELCIEIGEPIIQSEIAHTIDEAIAMANKIGYPVVLRPAFTLGGTGGGFAYNDEDTRRVARLAIELSTTSQVLVEKSLLGYKEIEFEVIRDNSGYAMAVCDMENIDPVGVHTGDSIVVAPCKTLAKDTLSMLKTSALKLINALNIYGGCNVQFALDPNSNDYFLIEVNPRVSRSSALASKATGFPIAYITSKIAIGYNLDELEIQGNKASIEPIVEYNVVKMARFYFDKFKDTKNELTTQMKATGEIMALGYTFKEALLKAVESLDNGYNYFVYDNETNEDLLERIEQADDKRIYIIGQLLRDGISVDQIVERTKITKYFIEQIKEIIDFEKELTLTKDSILEAKQIGFSDEVIAHLLNKDTEEIRDYRIENEIKPNYAMVDSCIRNGNSIPYYYSTYNKKNEVKKEQEKSVLVIGSGPIRIGQGIEFDYSTVHCINTIKAMGYKAIVINNNPETISTDYRISDKLYFEPLSFEKVMDVIDLENPIGVIIQLGGQTAINLGSELVNHNIKILGTSYESIEIAENRNLFEKVLNDNNIRQPEGKTIDRIDQGISTAHSIGYPLLVRPSFVLGGQSMRIVNNDDDLVDYLNNVDIISKEQPVLLDKYIKGKEVELDAVCDGKSVLIPGIMEHIEKTGVHSGDSISVYPTFSLSKQVIKEIVDITTKIGLALNIVGLYNIQFIVDELENVYIIELNPRASRSIPFISKATGVNASELATRVMLGEHLYQQGLVQPIDQRYYVKAPTFSFSKIEGLDTNLGPEMKSTGEAIGYDYTLNKALYKALQASGMKIKDYGTVFITVADEDKKEGLALAKRFYRLGFNIVATRNTADYLKQNGLRVKTLTKISEGSNEIIEWIRNDYIKYIINTQSIGNSSTDSDGYIIRTNAASNNITTFTSLDTVNVLLSILEERDINVEAI